MAGGGRYFQSVYNIHIHTTQEGDKTDVRVEKKTETNIINSPIEQVIVQQVAEANDAEEYPVDDEQGEVVQGVGEMDLFSSSHPATSVKKKVSTSSDQEANNDAPEDRTNEEHHEIVQAVDEMNLTPSSHVPTSAKKKGSTSSDQGRSSQKYLPDVRKSHKKSFRCEFIEGQSAYLCARSKFEEAASCIEQLTSEEKENLGLNTLLVISECYAELGRDVEAEKAIKTLTRLLITSPTDVYDVIKFAGDLIAEECYFCALVLLRISSDMYVLNTQLSPDDIVRGILKCANEMQCDVIKPMIKSGGKMKDIALKYGRTFKFEMFDTLRAVENVSPASKAESEAWILLYRI